MALYHKYRPKKFSQLEGQDSTKEILINSLRSGKLGHAYLLVGPRGLGKTSTARLLAKAINCAQPSKGEACNKCSSCVAISKTSHPDVVEIDAASNRGIDEIRELKSKLDLAPGVGKRRVFVIDEVHMLTREAFNALLKTLEEPPSHLLFILATTEAHKVPATILSRVQRFDFRKPTTAHLARYLKKIARREAIEIDSQALEKISQLAEGSYRDALVLLEQVSQSALHKAPITLERVITSLGLVRSGFVDEAIELLHQRDLESSLKLLDKLSGEGVDFGYFGQAIIAQLRLRFRKTFDLKYINWLELFAQALDQVKYSPAPSLPFELAIAKIINSSKRPKSSRKPSPNPPQKILKPTQPKNPPSPVLKRVPRVPKTRQAARPGGGKKLSQETWKRAIAHLKKTNPSLAIVLGGSSLEPLKSNRVVVRVAHKFAKENLEKGKNRAKIQKLLTEISGKKFLLDFTVRKKQANADDNKNNKNASQEIEKIFG